MTDMEMNEVSMQEIETIDGGLAPLAIGAVVILGGLAYAYGHVIGKVVGDWWAGE